MKKICIFLLAAVLLVGLSSCNNPDNGEDVSNSIVGIWEWTQDVTADDEILYVIMRIIEFNKDGTFITTENDVILSSGTYLLNNDMLIITTEESVSELKVIWEDENTVFIDDGIGMRIIRK